MTSTDIPSAALHDPPSGSLEPCMEKTKVPAGFTREGPGLPVPLYSQRLGCITCHPHPDETLWHF